MTTAPDLHDQGDDDRLARQLHAAALAHTSAPTLARLRQARHAASAGPRRRLFAPWLAGGAVAAAVALAVMLLPGTQPGPAGVPQVAGAPAAQDAATTADPAQSLQEDPGFYVWLDSVDATALAME